MAISDIQRGAEDASNKVFLALNERRKKSIESTQSNVIITAMEDKITREMAKQGLSEDAIKASIKSFDTLRKADLGPTETMAIGKMLAPEVFQDDLTRAIKQSNLANSQAKLSASTLPENLRPLSKDATPEQKSSFLDSLDPKLAETVQGLSDYSLDPSKVSSLRSGERMAVLAATKMYDPSFDMKKYPAQQKYIQQLSSTQRGTIGGAVNSANTLIAHLDLMDNQIEKLKNTNLKPANAIINLAKNITGDPSITDFDQAKAVVDSELEVLLTGVGATQQGLDARRSLLSENAGYDQMKSAIRTIGHILQARTKPLEQQYEALFNKPAGDTIVHADSKEVLNRLYSVADDSKSSKKVDLKGLFG